MNYQERAVALHREFEGYRLRPYRCPEGFLTVGWGLNLDAGLSKQERAYCAANHLDPWRELPEPHATWFLKQRSRQAEMDARAWLGDAVFVPMDDIRKAALIDFAYNLGLTKLRKWRTTRRLIISARFKESGEAMKKSLWYTQVKRRASIIIGMIANGKTA